MIFIDSNIPMYLIGAPHQHKDDAKRLLERAITEQKRLVTSVEVFQEILQRYTAIQRREAIVPAFDTLKGVVDEVFPIELTDVERAKGILLQTTSLSARDVLHLAVMERHSVKTIMSFDTSFDDYPAISRIHR
jgi:predicted nucleic acid-binding protein